jgi:TfoX/Sxy family transcriptional regulator of competence genes
MAYDEGLAQRLRDAMVDERGVVEKKMFGGLCLMVDGKMCVGIIGDELMARVGVEGYAAALKREGARPMDFTGKPLKGFVYVSAEGIESERALGEWVQLGVAYAREQARAERAKPGKKKSVKPAVGKAKPKTKR